MSEPAKKWEEEDDRRLAEMVASGAPFSIAAHQLGRTRNSCIGRAHRLGLTGGANSRPRTAPRIGPPRPPAKPRVIGPVPIEAIFAPVVEAVQPAAVDGPTILTISHRQCRWAIGEGDVIGRHIFCGKATDGVSSYCCRHKRLSYR